MSLNIKVEEGHEKWRGKVAIDIADEYANEASKELYVYKVLIKQNGDYYSIHRKFPYELGKEYQAKFGVTLTQEHLEFGEGLHAFVKKPDPLPIEPYVLCEFRIPKGAKYFLDSYDDEIVANKIQFVREVRHGN
jgi:hypothetical protein